MSRHFQKCVTEKPPAILPDIYPALFDWCFETEEFLKWHDSSSTWQLHCVGGLGSGKTTLSALAIRKLQELRGNDEKTAVASLFLRKDILSNDVNFVEDCLVSIYQQLNESDEGSTRAFQQYEEACRKGNRIMLRIEAIREALIDLLSSMDRAFLIVDDFDRCHPAAELIFRQQLAVLQQHHLKIMTTSRIPLWGADFVSESVVPEAMTCDGERCRNLYKYFKGPPLRLFWICASCTDIIMCSSCIKDEPLCTDCSKFYEPYDHRNLDIDNISDKRMEAFVAWDLEREHGALGFGSSSEAERRPPSTLGTVLRQNNGGNADKLRGEIVSRADGNVGMAKLRLESRYDSDIAEEVTVTRDRLPDNIVACFDAGVRRLEEQSKFETELGLKIIVASFLDSDCIPLATLESRMETCFRSAEEILQVTRGFVRILLQDPPKIEAFHPDFALYVKDDYNESLFWAKSKLRLKRIPRSASVEVFRIPELAPMGQKVLGHFPVLQISNEDDGERDIDRLGRMRRGRSHCWGYIWKSADLK
ncbi:MAG: hypothetical protein M1820_003935 [Bogoriella megaspora]|nr:MAG: hypothetical protein M1820_003935 [Bogoriella megaspora]